MELWQGRAGQTEGKDEGGKEKHKTCKKKKKNIFGLKTAAAG